VGKEIVKFYIGWLIWAACGPASYFSSTGLR